MPGTSKYFKTVTSLHIVKLPAKVLMLAFLPAHVNPSAQQATTPEPTKQLQRAAATLIGNASAPGDVRLTGSAIYMAGPEHPTVPIVLISRADGTTRIDLTLPAGTLSALRFPISSRSSSEVSTPKKGITKIDRDNLLIESAWFFPETLVGRLASNPERTNSFDVTDCDPPLTCIASDLGMLPNQISPSLQQLGHMKLALDASSLPKRLEFVTHPAASIHPNMPVRVYYDNYQNVLGHTVPFHITEYINGTLYLDITLQRVDLNVTLSPSDLAL